MGSGRRVTYIEGGLSAVSAGHQQRPVCVEFHRRVVVSVRGGAPAFHESHPVACGIGVRPVATHAVIVDDDVELQPL